MTKGQRTIATLLAIIAAILAAHLVRLGDQEAQAEHGPPPDFLSAAPVVVGISVDEDSGAPSAARLLRVWSDGSVDATWLFFGTGSGDQNCVVLDSCGPVSILNP